MVLEDFQSHLIEVELALCFQAKTLIKQKRTLNPMIMELRTDREFCEVIMMILVRQVLLVQIALLIY